MKSIQTFAVLVASAGFLVSGTLLAQADPSEKEKLKQCELSICELIVKKNADGGNISCDLTKTWGAKELKKGASQGKLKWSWGDAKCHTKVDLPRGPIIKALNDPSADVKLAPTAVECTIGGSEKSEVSFTLAPSLHFEKGAVTKAQLGIDNIKGSFMKRMVLKSAQLMDKSKLLNGVMAKEVNRFIKKCPEQMK